MRRAGACCELALNEDELAFYDALETNESAVKVLGDETLRTIARELVAAVHGNVKIDWTRRENVRAHLRVLVKRILRQVRLPAGQAGEAHSDRPGAGRGAERGLGQRASVPSCLRHQVW
jgi:type I restriction enzyme R subunit